jgi:hypothetical protein
MCSYPRAIVHSFVLFLLSHLSLQFVFLVSIHFVFFFVALAKVFGWLYLFGNEGLRCT